MMGGCCGAMKTGQKSLPEQKKSSTVDANQEKSNGKEPVVARSDSATETGKTQSPEQESGRQDGPKDAVKQPTQESAAKVSLNSTEPVKGKAEADCGVENVMDLETAVAPFEGVISNDQPPPQAKVDSTDSELLIPYQIPMQHTFCTPAATTTTDATAKHQEFQLRIDEPQLEANPHDSVQLSIIEDAAPTSSVNKGELHSSPADEAEAVPPATDPSTTEATPADPQPRVFVNVEMAGGANGDANIEERGTVIENSFSLEAQGGLDEIVSSVDQRQGDSRQELTADEDLSLPASSVSDLDANAASEQGLESIPSGSPVHQLPFDSHLIAVCPPDPSIGLAESDHQLPDSLVLMTTTELTYNEHETPGLREEATSASFGGEQVTPVAEFQLDKEFLEEPATWVQTQEQELTPTDEHDLQQPNVADLETAPESVNLVSAASDPESLQDIQMEASEEKKQPCQPQADERILANVAFEVPSKPELYQDETESGLFATVKETLSSDNLPTTSSVPQGEAEESPVTVPAQDMEFEPGIVSKDFQQETAQAESALESHPIVEVGTDLPVISVLVDDSAKEKNDADDDNGAVSSFHLDESLVAVPDSLQTGRAEEFPSHLESRQAPQSEFEQQLKEPASHHEPLTNESVDGPQASVADTSDDIQSTETVEKLEEQLPHHEPSADFVDEVQASVAEPSDVDEPPETVYTPEALASFQGPETVDESPASVPEISGKLQTSETVQTLEEELPHHEPSADFVDEVQASVAEPSDVDEPPETVYTPEALASFQGPETVDESPASAPEISGEFQTSETVQKLEEQLQHNEPSIAGFIDEVQESIPETSDDIRPSETVEIFEEPVLHQEQSKTDFVDETPAAITEAADAIEHSETVERLDEHHEPSITEFSDEVQSLAAETSGEFQRQEIVEKLEEHHKPSTTDFIDEVHKSLKETSDKEHSETVEKLEEQVSHQEPSITDFVDEAPVIVTEAYDDKEHSAAVEKFDASVLHHEPSTAEFIDEVQSSVPETFGEIQPSETETVKKLEEHQEPPIKESIDEVHTSFTEASDVIELSDTVQKFEEPLSHHEPSATELIDEAQSSVPQASGETQSEEIVEKVEEPVSHHEPSTTEFINDAQISVPGTSDEIHPSEAVEKLEEPVPHQEQSKTDFVHEATSSVTETYDATGHSETVEKLEEPLSHHEPSTTEFFDEVHSPVLEASCEIQSQEIVEKVEEHVSHHEPPTTKFLDEVRSSAPEASSEIQSQEIVKKVEEHVSHHEPPTTEFINDAQVSVPETLDEIHPSDTVEKLEQLVSHHEQSKIDVSYEAPASLTESSDVIEPSETVEELEETVSHHEATTTELIGEVQSVSETSGEIQNQKTVQNLEKSISPHEQSKTDFTDEAQASLTEAFDFINHIDNVEKFEEMVPHHEPSTTEFLDEVQSPVLEASSEIQSQEIVEKVEEHVTHHESSTTESIDDVNTSVTEAYDAIEHSETVEKIEEHQESPTADFVGEAPAIVTEAHDAIEHSETVETFDAPVLHHEPSTTESIDEVQSSVPETSGEIQPSETETVEKLEEEVSHPESPTTEFIGEVHASVAETSDVSELSDTVQKFEEPPSHHEPSTAEFFEEDQASFPEASSGEIQTSETLETPTVLELVSEQARDNRDTWWKEGGQLAADGERPVLELVTGQAQQSRQTWWEQSDPESASENADLAALPSSSESVPPPIDQREEVPPESCSAHPDELSPIPPNDDDDDDEAAAVPLPIPTDDTVSPSQAADDSFPDVIPDPLPSVFDDNNPETVPEGKTPPDSAVESPLSVDGGGEEGGRRSAVPTESGDDAMTQSSDGAYASASPDDSTPSSAAQTPGDVVDPPADASKEPISAQA